MQVKIASMSYEIRHVGSDVLSDQTYGLIKYRAQEILVGPASPERQRLTLMHEILHGIIEEYGIRELRDGDGNQPECAIDQLALGLYQALESLGLMLPTKEQE